MSSVMEAFSMVEFLAPVMVEDGSLASRLQEEQPPVRMRKMSETPEEIKRLLSTIFPPRKFEHDGQVWRQVVSAVATDR